MTISLGRGDIVLRPYFAYPEYMSLTKQNAPTIPNAVVNKVINKDMTPIRAWREHLLIQTEVACRLGISQSAYAQQEAKEPVRKATREKIAKALGSQSSWRDEKSISIADPISLQVTSRDTRNSGHP